MSLEFEVSLADAVSGPASKMADSVGGLAKEFDALAPGVGAAVAVIGGLAAGMVAVTGALAATAVGAVESKNVLLSKFGKPTLDMFDELSSKVGMTREELAPLADKFKAMGITDVPKLRQSLLAAASASALITGGGEAYATLARKIQEATQAGIGLKLADKQLASLAATGVNVDDVAKEMGKSTAQLRAQLKAGTVNAKDFGDALQAALIKKGAGPLETMAGSLANVWKLAKESFTQLFEDVDIKPLIDGMKDLLSIFSQGQPSGQALKAGITGALNAVFKGLAFILPYVKKFFEYLIIWGLKAYIFVRTHWDLFKSVLKGVGVLVVAVFGILAAAAAIVIVPFLAMVAAGIAIGTAIAWVAGKIYDFVSGAGKALDDWVTSAVDIAANFVSGLVAGIKAGVSKVVDAVKDLGTKAKDTLKGMLGISSPSKVMMELGAHTSSGFASGISQGAGDVASASGSMAAAASTPAATPASQGGGGPTTVNVSVQIDGAGKSAEQITEEMIVTTFERLAAAQGL